MRAHRSEKKARRGPPRLRRALAKALSPVFGRIGEADLEEVEERLILADFGVDAAARCVAAVEAGARKGDGVLESIGREIRAVLGDGPGGALRVAAEPPSVYVLLGVNGAGKTTTAGKLAARLADAGRSVLLAAADTYRAGAVAQLERWAQRSGAGFVRGQPGGDPASVAFDAVAAGKARGTDAVLVDTAGRLHTQGGLMAELAKIARVLGAQHPGAPHETLLVLDAASGQNSLAQARAFSKAVPLSGVVMAKMDSTARGGIVVALKQELGLDVRLAGVGEAVGDLEDFDPDAFVQGVLAAP